MAVHSTLMYKKNSYLCLVFVVQSLAKFDGLKLTADRHRLIGSSRTLISALAGQIRWTDQLCYDDRI